MTDKKRREGVEEDEASTQAPSAAELPTAGRTGGEEPGEGLTPAQRKALRTVIEGLARLSRDIAQRDTFSAGPVSFRFVRVLEERGSGAQVLLFERHLRHGLAGHVVVKRLQNPRTFERRQRMREEVHLAFRLRHPAIAQVHHLRIIEGAPHVIMEHVDGPTLESLLSTAALRGSPLPTPFALYMAAEVAEALHHAHTLTEEETGGRPLGLIHRDVSPRNIRVDRTTGAVKLTDFGAAFSKRVGREETQGRLVKGDVLYASPEYLHLAPMDARSDIFSLGLVLLEALTSRHLFELEDLPQPPEAPRVDVTPEEAPSFPLARMMVCVDRYGPADVARAVAELPEGLQAVLHRALQREPAARHASAAELHQELRAQLLALAPGYGRREAAEEVARLISEASAMRDVAEPLEGGIYPSYLDEHELIDTGERSA
jgi:eukaryotic-like serine/threonine-protein kinase